MRWKSLFLVLVLFLSAALVQGADPTPQEEAIEKNRVSILSFDEHGTLLRSGIGFLYDGNTLICGYSNVKGASSIKAEEEGSHSYSTRLISYSDSYDFAVLKTEEEDMNASSLAGSDTLAVGDKVYFFQREQGKWKLMQAMVKGWIDSGEGYETIRLQ